MKVVNLSRRLLTLSRIAFVLPVLFAGNVARAEAPKAERDTAVSEAREHALRAADLFRDKDVRGALVEYRRAYEIAPNWRVQYNIGLCCYDLQDWACALSAFDRYLTDGGDDVPRNRVQSVTEDIGKLRRRVATVRVAVDVSGAEIAVDDMVVGVSPLAAPLVVTAGQRRITATLASNPPITKFVAVVGGDDIDVSFELRAPIRPALGTGGSALLESEVAAAPPPQGSASDSRASSRRPGQVPFIIAASATGALTAATAIAGLMALGAKSDLDATLNRFGIGPDDVDSARSKTTTLAATADILLAASVIGAAVTGYLFFTTVLPHSSRSPTQARATLGVGAGPGLGVLRGEF